MHQDARARLTARRNCYPTPLQPTDDDAFDPSRTTELHGQVAWTGPTSSRSSMAGARARQPEARHHHLIDRFDRSPALLDLRLGGRHCAEQLGPTKRGAFGSSGSGRGDNASSGLLRAQDNRLAS
jgi:hypothetical protein